MLSPDQILYLDNNATTQLDPAVAEEMLPFLTTYYGNPSSGYRFGAQVREAVDLARERVAASLGCAASEIVFTSGGTEANNTVLQAALLLEPARQHLITSAVEHSAILRQTEELVRRGGEVTAIKVDAEGQLDLDELEKAIRPETAIISVMWANNETGVVFPVEKIAEIARARDVLFHTDAIQFAGKMPIDLADAPINFLSLSAHKFHGPKGVGALYISRRSPFRPLLFGGGQEEGRRSGTENVAAIVGFGKAAELATQAMSEQQSRIRQMRDRFEQTLLASTPETSVNGGRALRRLPNTSSLCFAGIESEAALLLLDQQRLCCSAGSACHTGALRPSHVLRAMNLSDERARSSLRFSFSRFNTEAEIDHALEIIPRVITKLRQMSVRENIA